MKKLILAILLTVASTSAMAQWIKSGEVVDGTAFNEYANLSTIQRAGHMVKMWSLRDYKKSKSSVGEKPYLSTKAQFEYDCNAETSSLQALINYSGNMGSGDVTYTYYNHVEPRSISPDSMDESLWKIACGKK